MSQDPVSVELSFGWKALGKLHRIIQKCIDFAQASLMSSSRLAYLAGVGMFLFLN